MVEVGARSWNLKRVINLKLGLTAANDTLPAILMKPFPDGGSAGYIPPLAEMLEAYYEAREWDKETGKPTQEKMEQIGLVDRIDDIWK